MPQTNLHTTNQTLANALFAERGRKRERENASHLKRQSIENSFTAENHFTTIESRATALNSNFSKTKFNSKATKTKRHAIATRTLATDAKTHAISAGSFAIDPKTFAMTSKTFAMTGWRLGYAVAPKEVADYITKIQLNTVSCPVSFASRAGGPWERPAFSFQLRPLCPCVCLSPIHPASLNWV